MFIAEGIYIGRSCIIIGTSFNFQIRCGLRPAAVLNGCDRHVRNCGIAIGFYGEAEER